MRTKIVTGFIPISGHPRAIPDYESLGARLLALPVPMRAFLDDELQSCWLARFLKTLPPVTHSIHDNPAKNTLAYHVATHQKSEWLRRAAVEDSETDVFVWIDYGIFKLPGVTEEVVLDFLGRVDDRGLSIPGCWPRGPVDDQNPCWRFCGGVVVCPRSQAAIFDEAVKREAERHIRETNNVSWEVNTWARAELRGFPVLWYPADHDRTMFANFSAR